MKHDLYKSRDFLCMLNNRYSTKEDNQCTYMYIYITLYLLY